MKPLFPYYGGKARLAQRIVGLMPPHRVYLEPYFGSGAVLFAKRPASIEVINDADENVVTFFRVLRDRPEQLEQVCSLSPYARDEFVDADLDEPDLDDLERARRFWIRITQSFSQTAGAQTGWSVTTARTAPSVAETVRRRLPRFGEIAERLLSTVIENCDAVDLVTRLATDETVVYADPPYLSSTRRQGRTWKLADYRCDMSGEEAHERLAEVLHATPATVLLSGYDSPLYAALYRDWWRAEWRVKVHASNALTGERGDRVEVLWSNRQLDEGTLFTADGGA